MYLNKKTTFMSSTPFNSTGNAIFIRSLENKEEGVDRYSSRIELGISVRYIKD